MFWCYTFINIYSVEMQVTIKHYIHVCTCSLTFTIPIISQKSKATVAAAHICTNSVATNMSTATIASLAFVNICKRLLWCKWDKEYKNRTWCTYAGTSNIVRPKINSFRNSFKFISCWTCTLKPSNCVDTCINTTTIVYQTFVCVCRG